MQKHFGFRGKRFEKEGEDKGWEEEGGMDTQGGMEDKKQRERW
jgi:hypothetical protein